MADREAMLDTIYRAYDARGKGDIEGLMGTFHPDAASSSKATKLRLTLRAPCTDIQLCGQR